MEKILDSHTILFIIFLIIWGVSFLTFNLSWYIKNKVKSKIVRGISLILIGITFPILPSGFIIDTIVERNINIPNVDTIWYENCKVINLDLKQDDDNEYHYNVLTKYGTISKKDSDIPYNEEIKFIDGPSYVKYKFHKYTERDWAKVDEIITTITPEIIYVSSSYQIEIFND